MAFICLWAVFFFQTLVSLKKAKGKEEVDFRNVVKCNKVANSFEGLTCVREEPLGRGAKSLAFLVEYKGNKRVLLIQKKNATEAMLIREQLGEHPAIIHIDRFKPTRNWSFYVMEWGEEGSLSDFRKNQKKLFKNMTFALEFLKKVVEGTLHISQKGFVHSDLKLANIVVDAQFNPKIIDFELATRKDRQYHWRGTTSYMAPEVLRASKKDKKISFTEKVDVYSIGVLFFRALFGDYPYEERDKGYLYADIRDEVYFLPEGFDVEVAKLFVGCLKFKRRDRFTLTETLDQINKALAAGGAKSLWRYEALGTVGTHFFLEEKKVPQIEGPAALNILGVGWLLSGLILKSLRSQINPNQD
jgi:serine/threonine protein kinase